MTDSETRTKGATPAVTAASRYEALTVDRDPFLRRAREAAELTIPGLMPPEGCRGGSDLPTPYQSTGADAVNNLAAKLLLALFPPGASFFRLAVDEMALVKLQQQVEAKGESFEDFRGEVDAALSMTERAVINKMEAKGSRSVNEEAIKHLIVAGNGLIHTLPDGSEKFFPLDQFVVQRDLSGNVLEIVVKESLSKLALPPEAQAIVAQRIQVDDSTSDQLSVDLYTWVRRTSSGWKVEQQIDGQIVPKSEGTYPKEKSAWLPLRWAKVARSGYGRGRVEEYLGDFRSLDSLTMAILMFGAAASKHLIFVDPNGVTSAKEVANAPNGKVLPGTAKDLSGFQLDKAQDFRVVWETAQAIQHRLEKAFLLASAVQRSAERVTAEEIRLMVGELETALGGVYSVLAEEFQRPLIVRVLHQMQVAREVPRLSEKLVSPQIVTGLDGLGRASDLQRLDTFISGVSAQFGPQAVVQHINVGAYMQRRAAALGIKTDGLIKSADEIAKEQQQDNMRSIAPSLIAAAQKNNQLAAEQQAPGAQAPDEAEPAAA